MEFKVAMCLENELLPVLYRQKFFTVRGYKNPKRNPYELRQSSPLYRRSNTPKKMEKITPRNHVVVC